jgi:hypothetical protein
VLTDADKAKYARQILLTELGAAGQERLGATRVQLVSDADPRAAEVARAYLERAGVGAHAQGVDQAASVVAIASTGRIAQVAGDPALEDCAAWLLGALAAVEAIKSASGVGTPAVLSDDFVLSREVV